MRENILSNNAMKTFNMLDKNELLDIFKYPVLILRNSEVYRMARSYIEGIKISDKMIIGPVTLRPISKKDKVPSTIKSNPSYGCILELSYRDEKHVSSQYCEPLEIFKRTLNTFRILFKEKIGMSPIFYFDTDGTEFGELVHPVFALANGTIPSQVSIGDKSIFKKNFMKILSSQYNKHLANPIERFSRACSESYDQSIIDFLIALEATLGFELDMEISHRLSARGAYILSPKNTEKRFHYYQTFRYFYQLRSRMVHGLISEINLPKQKQRESIEKLGYNIANPKDMSIYRGKETISEIIRDLTRKVLLKFIHGKAVFDSDWLIRIELGSQNKNLRT